MDLFAREKKELVRKIFEKMVDLINKEINLDEFKDSYFPDENRTLEMNIGGLEDVATGFVFEDGKVRTIKKLIDKPTVIFTMDEDTFIRMAMKRQTFSEAFFLGDLDIHGDNYLRDFRIFQRMFEAYGNVLDKMGR